MHFMKIKCDAQLDDEQNAEEESIHVTKNKLGTLWKPEQIMLDQGCAHSVQDQFSIK